MERIVEIEPREFWEDQDWGFKHYSDLVKKYPDKWVAIVHKEVIAAGDLEKVEKEAEKKVGKKHVPVLFVESGSHIY